jgi:hypothetical protein
VALLFCMGLLGYFAVFLRGRWGESSVLSRLLWSIYFALGCSAVIIVLTGALEPTFSPNYSSVLYLLLCLAIGISGFLRFRAEAVADVVLTIRGQGLIETVLIALQSFSIAFFLPFAIGSLSGDAGANRLQISGQQEVLASYGLINSFAGVGAHLFTTSLVMACIRLCQPKGGGYNPPRAGLLVLSSLAYVIYVLAYVGRDGSVYWLMNALLVFLLFRNHLPDAMRRRIVVIGSVLAGMVILPIIIITMSRFGDSDFGVGGSLLEYFGAQIHHFSDFTAIDRPKTYGAQNFPLFWPLFCSNVGDIGCADWEVLRPFIFDIYLSQGKQPWVFGTYVSDFVADFGYMGTLGLLVGLAVLCDRACAGRDGRGRMSPSRLLMIILLFLTPYWGVFYFRFGIMNTFLLVNVFFIGCVWVLQVYLAPRAAPRWRPPLTLT